MVNRYVACVLACWRCALTNSWRTRAFSVSVHSRFDGFRSGSNRIGVRWLLPLDRRARRRSGWYRHVTLLECNVTLDTLRLLPLLPQSYPQHRLQTLVHAECLNMLSKDDFGFRSPRDVLISYPIGELCVFSHFQIFSTLYTSLRMADLSAVFPRLSALPLH